MPLEINLQGQKFLGRTIKVCAPRARGPRAMRADRTELKCHANLPADKSLRMTSSTSAATVRISCCLASLALCLWGIWTSARVGAARLLAEYGVQTKQIAPTDLAIRLAPADPEAYYARAAVFTDAGAIQSAQAAYEQALNLRPADYLLWLELGKLREQASDSAGALAAFAEALRLAPYYAEPRWQLGNTYLRLGRTSAAFSELRRAATGDPQRFPNLLELAWHVARQVPLQFSALVSPETPAEHLRVAHFLARHEAPQPAVVEFRAAGGANLEPARRDLVRELLAARAFAEAFAIWSDGRASEQAVPGEITNGGFEQPVRLDDAGFDWQLASGDAGGAFRLSLDETMPRAGARSLQLEFNGNSAPGHELATQLVLVAPGARYRLRFFARTTQLVTGGPALMRVTAAAAGGPEPDRPLAESTPLLLGTTDWREYTVEFTAPAGVRAVRLALLRANCSSGGGPCPAFGRIWLDEFKLEKL